MTTDEARALDNILRDVRVVDAKGDQIAWEINTLLPHGEWGTQGGPTEWRLRDQTGSLPFLN